MHNSKGCCHSAVPWNPRLWLVEPKLFKTIIKALHWQANPYIRDQVYEVASAVVFAPVKEGQILHPGQTLKNPPLTEGQNFQQELIIYEHETLSQSSWAKQGAWMSAVLRKPDPPPDICSSSTAFFCIFCYLHWVNLLQHPVDAVGGGQVDR